MTNVQEFKMFKGDHKTFELQVKDQDGNPIDLSGATIRMTVKKHATDETAVISKTSNNASEISITDPANGIAEIYLVPSDTRNLDAGKYIFDIEITTAAGKVYTVLLANLTLVEDVSK